MSAKTFTQLEKRLIYARKSYSTTAKRMVELKIAAISLGNTAMISLSCRKLSMTNYPNSSKAKMKLQILAQKRTKKFQKKKDSRKNHKPMLISKNFSQSR